MEPALVRMHESESWGQDHPSVKEGGERRRDGGTGLWCVCWAGVEGGADIKERSKANGFMVTVLIRLAENHFISYRAKELGGFQRCVGMRLAVLMYVFNMKERRFKAGL